MTTTSFSRFESLIGKEKLDKIKRFKVLIFGIGGVGGYVVEALVRSGVMHFTLVDNDVVEESNINRQIVADITTLGKSKVDVMKSRIFSINPEAEVEAIKKFYLPEDEDEFDFSKYDYIIDCVDTVSAKLSIICKAKELNKPVISALGAGNKLDPSKLEIADIYKTSVDPLAKVLRRELRKRNIKSLKVAYSKEEPLKPETEIASEHGRHSPCSAIFVPASMGLLIASEVIKDLIL